jgi:DNA-binding transcriptional regulator GbsR (MarR family)
LPKETTLLISDSKLIQAKQQFIQTWGEMAFSWGISKTMAQIHAFLYTAETPVDTDEIMAFLDISRGSANMNLRNLVTWGLVKKTEKNARRDFFIAEKDLWNIAAIIIRERQQKELKPVSSSLKEIITFVSEDNGGPRLLNSEEKTFISGLKELHDFLILFNGFSASLLPLLKDIGPEQLEQISMVIGKNAD